MWRTDGAGEMYTYLPPSYSANQAVCNVAPKSECNSVYGASVGRGSFSFAAGKRTMIGQRVRLNDVGQENGELELFVDGESIFTVSGLVLRNSDAGRFHGIQMQTFFGGTSRSTSTPAAASVSASVPCAPVPDFVSAQAPTPRGRPPRSSRLTSPTSPSRSPRSSELPLAHFSTPPPMHARQSRPVPHAPHVLSCTTSHSIASRSHPGFVRRTHHIPHPHPHPHTHISRISTAPSTLSVSFPCSTVIPFLPLLSRPR